MNIYEYIRIDENEKPLDRMVTDGGMCAIFRTIACVGDSLSSGEFESRDKDGKVGYHDMYEYSWGQHIGRACGSKVYNFSCGGMAADRYNSSFAPSRGFFDAEKAAQAYIIAMGANDVLNEKQTVGKVSDINLEDYTQNVKTFAGHYAEMIQRYKEIQPDAKFFLVTMPRSNDPVRDAIKKAHRDLLADMCDLFDNCYLIDLYTYSPVHDKEFQRKFYMSGHLDPMGYVLTARMIESYIDYIIRHNPKEFKQVGFIGTPLYNVTVK